MDAYPSDTIFFINAWTWGYEDLLERISMCFDAPVNYTSYHIHSPKSFHSITKLNDICILSVLRFTSIDISTKSTPSLFLNSSTPSWVVSSLSIRLRPDSTLANVNGNVMRAGGMALDAKKLADLKTSEPRSTKKMPTNGLFVSTLPK